MKSREQKYREAVARNIRRMSFWINELTKKDGKKPDPKHIAHLLGVRITDGENMRVIADAINKQSKPID